MHVDEVTGSAPPRDKGYGRARHLNDRASSVYFCALLGGACPVGARSMMTLNCKEAREGSHVLRAVIRHCELRLCPQQRRRIAPQRLSTSRSRARVKEPTPTTQTCLIRPIRMTRFVLPRGISSNLGPKRPRGKRNRMGFLSNFWSCVCNHPCLQTMFATLFV